MAYTYEELKPKNVKELREIAVKIEHEAVKGYSQLNKEHLLKAICTALNIDMHQHHHVVGINKTQIKAKIREFKKKRDTLMEAHKGKNPKELIPILERIHAYKHKLRKATV